ncbi:MAG: bifunctional DNA-formamidopyrimidine glycosylase/DNA-(apurinic or apyrimidinic site) lyase [Alphaproteobacteria bacterium]|nr:bifunctional DNA-formamidopyrimidine glycosylase/DNA-(apurinic or apyrimidinic site) lyase [Alphaproteobacteria bacterium]
MPELPEVETVRRGLLPVLEGHHIVSAKTRRGNLRIPFPPRFAERLKGRTVQHLRRRAKYLVADLDSGESLIVHLGMSGRMTIYRKGKVFMPGEFEQDTIAAEEGHGLHDHVIFETDAPARIVFTDHRRFGLMTLLKTDELDADKLFKDIGPEPLGNAFSEPVLSAALKGKKTSIKAALLDQRVVAGLGNIYVCEALFRAHISPKRKASTIAGKRAEVLVPAIKRVLGDAIEAGGSTLRDYAKTDGSLGYFQHRFSVYDREGEPCPAKGCKGTIKRLVQAGRSTFFCPACQK